MARREDHDDDQDPTERPEPHHDAPEEAEGVTPSGSMVEGHGMSDRPIHPERLHTFYGRYVGGEDLFTTCNNLEEMIERVDELKSLLLEMWADRVELLDPVMADGGLLVTDRRDVAERHGMWQTVQFELADDTLNPPEAD